MGLADRLLRSRKLFRLHPPFFPLPPVFSAILAAAHNIHFVGMQMRRDIAYQALAEQAPDGLTYRSAGVDIDAGDALVDAIKPYAKRTSRTGCNAELGGYGGRFSALAFVCLFPVLLPACLLNDSLFFSLFQQACLTYEMPAFMTQC